MNYDNGALPTRATIETSVEDLNNAVQRLADVVDKLIVKSSPFTVASLKDSCGETLENVKSNKSTLREYIDLQISEVIKIENKVIDLIDTLDFWK